jgi:hypothetical protein
MDTGTEILTWLQSQPGLDVDVVGRPVGPDPAWQVDLAVEPGAGCDREGRFDLWPIEGGLMQLLFEGQPARVYLIERPGEIVVMFAETDSASEMPAFALMAESIFNSLRFE